MHERISTQDILRVLAREDIERGVFADRQSPEQRGTNENSNPLLRKYLPRDTDLSACSQAQFDQVAPPLNQRPRKTSGFQSTASKLQEAVFRLSDWSAVILIGYGIAEYVDHRLTKKAREKLFDDMLFGWEPSKDDSEYEEKGNLSRVRLTGQSQILAARIGDLFMRMR
jgi:hypothetical protein